MRMFRKEEGFTLVELMVVVLIIGILVAIAIPVFNAAKANAQRRSCQSNVRTIEGAYQTFIADDVGNLAIANAGDTDSDGYFTNAELGAIDSAAAGRFDVDFVKGMPTCPAAGTYSWEITNSGNSIEGSCTVAAHN